MNVSRHSLFDDLLFVMVLLLPPVFAGARYVESDPQLAHIFQVDPKLCPSPPALGAYALGRDAGRGIAVMSFRPGR